MACFARICNDQDRMPWSQAPRFGKIGIAHQLVLVARHAIQP